jgi:transcriptional regulator with XRE-family HTH domain
MSTTLNSSKGEEELDPEAVELGQNIRAFRQAGGLTLDQFARAVGVSRSLLSQVERGKASPSIATLRNVARVLGVPIAALFTGGTQTDGETDRFGRRIVVRKGERRHLDHLAAEGISYELLTSDINRKIEFLQIEMAPGSRTPVDGASQHNGEENQICLSGAYVLDFDGQEFELSAGDSASFDASIPHVAYNRGRAPAVIVVAITPPNF